MQTLIVTHNEGFFSCCTVRLSAIINYYNKNRNLPDYVDSSKQFGWYKKLDAPDTDISHEYFVVPPEENVTVPSRDIDYSDGHQYRDFRTFDFTGIYPIIQRFFQPSQLITDIVQNMEIKYSIDYENLCVLFYRGNDKSREMPLANYADFVVRARKIRAQNPNVRFLVQSDETEFIETMLREFPGETVVFADEMRHISRCNNTVDKIFREDNHIYSKYFLAITIIMSKCKHIVCMSGNCSAWIIHYRNSAENVHQFLQSEIWLGD